MGKKLIHPNANTPTPRRHNTPLTTPQVILNNIHLMPRWLLQLEQKLDEFAQARFSVLGDVGI